MESATPSSLQTQKQPTNSYLKPFRISFVLVAQMNLNHRLLGYERPGAHMSRDFTVPMAPRMYGKVSSGRPRLLRSRRRWRPIAMRALSTPELPKMSGIHLSFAISFRLASAPWHLKARFATSRIRSRSRGESVRDFRWRRSDRSEVILDNLLQPEISSDYLLSGRTSPIDSQGHWLIITGCEHPGDSIRVVRYASPRLHRIQDRHRSG